MRYRTAVPIGEGGMGEVYKAWDPDLDRPVALKFLRHADPRLVERMLREAKAQARVRHENVCSVYDVGESEGVPYIAMQFVEGRPLDEVARELPLEARVRLVATVARAVHAAHEQGLVHRDLKPQNILVEETAEGLKPWVLDFGLARDASSPGLTQTGQVLGTPAYMAPEQAAGEISSIDRRTDVYALGALLFAVLAGEPLWDDPSGPRILVRILGEEPRKLRSVDPELPRPLETIVSRCVERRRDGRYPSARELADELERWLRGEPIRTRPAGPVERFVRLVRRHRVAAAALLVGFLAASGGLVSAWRARAAAEERAELARRFGESAQELQWRLRAVEMAPLHDIRPERQQIEARLAALESEVAGGGQLALGPGHYALGRARLALGEEGAARRHLERALESGYETSEVRRALGVALARLWAREVEEARRIGDEGLRRRRLEQLDAELRRPALRWLREGDSAPAAEVELVEALLAWLAGRESDGIRRARSAADGASWLYEARLLEGDIRRALADQIRHRGKGDGEDAEEAYAEADAAYLVAAEVAPSSAEAWTRRCSLWAAVMDLRLHSGSGDAVEAFGAGDPACGKAIRVDRSRPEAWVRRAALHRLRAEVAKRTGADPREWIGKAFEMTAEALEIDPEHTGALHGEGLLHQELAQWQAGHGEDPRPALERAVGSHRRAASALDEPVHWSALGLALSSLARAESFRGGDPEELFRSAAEALERAVRTAPDVAPLHQNLAEVWKNLGVHRMDDGEDPREALDRAIDHLERAVEIQPDDATSWRSLGVARWYLGEHRMQRNVDPEPIFRSALEALDRAREIDPGLALAATDSAAVHGLLAGWKIRNGRDPVSELESASSALDRALEINPDLVWVHFVRALNLKDRARWERMNGRDPDPWLRRAESSLETGLEIHGASAAAWSDLGLIRIERAEGAFARGSDPSELLAAARSALDRALEIAPEWFLALRGQADAALLEARWLARRDLEAREALDRAELYLERAVETNPGDPNIRHARARSALWRATLLPEGPEELRRAVEIGRERVAQWREVVDDPPDAHAVDAALEALLVAEGIGDRAAAERSRRRALEANPNLEEIYSGWWSLLGEGSSDADP